MEWSLRWWIQTAMRARCEDRCVYVWIGSESQLNLAARQRAFNGNFSVFIDSTDEGTRRNSKSHLFKSYIHHRWRWIISNQDPNPQKHRPRINLKCEDVTILRELRALWNPGSISPRDTFTIKCRPFGHIA